MAWRDYNIMDWTWNANGKRYKISAPNDTKRKRFLTADITMEDESIIYKRRMQQYQYKIDREIALYKQQMHEIEYNKCCRRQW
ncbi:hypothetical protein SteCoe_10890 [Stentor coeruleus]|uniref:Uncharacterized protein n=1 Tax=Stentor coeruleus TaxID=5963 RepID=A0A1R2CEK1_9CILI|nr:hypothetical protein SteCoe_10890 [Stentor coeruleus]